MTVTELENALKDMHKEFPYDPSHTLVLLEREITGGLSLKLSTRTDKDTLIQMEKFVSNGSSSEKF